MSAIRREAIRAALNKSLAIVDYNVCDDMHKQHTFREQTLLADKSLTEDEKTEAIKELYEIYDRDKIISNSGTSRICENCNKECLATLYCEFCIRDYLKANFSNWTSGNNVIDNLIQSCQLETIEPDGVIEWIPYNDLQNIKYLTKGSFSEIYTAVWIDGGYEEWNSKKQQLIRFGMQRVILKRLENVESANQRWFEEAKSHFTLSSELPQIVQCYGLTQDPLNGNYMLVIDTADVNLREYLQQNFNQLTWEERILIIQNIIKGLFSIHSRNVIHRDLHSGNILYSKRNQRFYISDLGFCGPADKPLESIYGNLPYIAPEVITGKNTTKKSDIYSIAMLMWEISSGQLPFGDYGNDYYLAKNIVNGIRPRIVSGTPLEYERLMKQCWDADPSKRPHTLTVFDKISEIILNNLYEPTQSRINFSSETNKANINYTSSRLFTSKIYQFGDFPEPRNATEEEQEEFYSKSYDNFYIPDNVDDFNKSNDSEGLSKDFNKLQINSKDEVVQNVYKMDVMQQQVNKHYTDDDDEILYNNPNLRSEQQDGIEIPDEI